MRVLEIDCQKTVADIVVFIKSEFAARRKKTAILGISGGLDSGVVAVLCNRAGLDLVLVSIPYGALSKKEEVGKVAGMLDRYQGCLIGPLEIDITEIVDKQTELLQKVMIPDEIDKGNIMARERMVIQYAMARQMNGLVVGTENLSEYYLGYCTLHGDQACDINPIASLWKTQVLEIAGYLGLPREVIVQKPSADLYEGQTDETELGFSYKEADPILRFHCLFGISEKELIRDLNFNSELVKKVLKRVVVTKYKREEILRYGCP